MKTLKHVGAVVLVAVVGLGAVAPAAFAEGTDFKSILQQGLLGAGVGAISAGASGGEAGKGALIGAGTNVIGGALLGFLTQGSSQPQTYSYYPVSQAQPVYAAPTPRYHRYYEPQPVAQPVYVQAAQPAHRRQIIVREYNENGRMISEREFWESI